MHVRPSEPDAGKGILESKAGSKLSRRSVMNMFVSGAAVAGASIVPEVAAAQTSEFSGVRTEMRKAADRLGDAYTGLKQAHAARREGLKAWTDWEYNHRAPVRLGQQKNGTEGRTK